MSVIAVGGVPMKYNLVRVIKLVAPAIKGHFEGLNFAPGSKNTKICYLRLSEKLDPLQVVENINSKPIGTTKMKAFIPDHVPDLPLASKLKQIPQKLRKSLRIPSELTPRQIDENRSEIATDTVDFENNNTVLEENDREENSNAADEIIENRVKELTETSSSTFTVPSKLATKESGKSNKRQDEVHEAIDKINKIAENVTKNTTSLLRNKEDVFDIFGRYIASTLRTLPRVFSIIAKTDIQKALSGIQLKALRQQTKSSLLSYGTSTSNISDPENPGYLSSASVSSLSNYEDDFNNISFTNT